jgi:hypothetical protein
MQNDTLSRLRNGEALNLSQQIKMILLLAIPAILSQISSTAMQYIDASMVGSLGAQASASIGLVSSTTWMFGGVSFAIITGFTVQVAHAIGAKDFVRARNYEAGLLVWRRFCVGFGGGWRRHFFLFARMVRGNTRDLTECLFVLSGLCLVSSFSTTELFGHRDAAGIREYEGSQPFEYLDVYFGCVL